jgi:hypothetical protein
MEGGTLTSSYRLARVCVAMLIAASPFGTRGAAAATANTPAELLEPVCRMVDGAAAANRLPAAYLARILWHESRLRSDATSPAGAEGVAQFMPRTAAERGLADPRDPAPSIAEAARLLADLNLRFGNRGLAAAAYNAGPGRVLKWLRRQSELPAETRLYVAAVTGRPVEDWAYSTAAGQIAGGDGEPCLAVLSGLVRSAPGHSSSGRSISGRSISGSSIPGALARLDRSLALAVGLLASVPPRRSAPGSEALRSAEALCASIRSLGAPCAVHQP